MKPEEQFHILNDSRGISMTLMTSARLSLFPYQVQHVQDIVFHI
jgi:hypothetical protein